MAHLSDDALLRLMDGASTASDHLPTCALCQSRLAQISSLFAGVEDLRPSQAEFDASLSAAMSRIGSPKTSPLRAARVRVRSFVDSLAGPMQPALVPLGLAIVFVMTLSLSAVERPTRLTGADGLRASTTNSVDATADGSVTTGSITATSSKQSVTTKTTNQSGTTLAGDNGSTTTIGGVAAPLTTTSTSAPGETPAHGYLLFRSDGSAQAFGAASVLNANDGIPNDARDAAMRSQKDGYWILDSNGRVYSFGNAANYGDASLASGDSALALLASVNGNGYFIVTTKGKISKFGDATFPPGSAPRIPATETIVAANSRIDRAHLYLISNTNAIYTWKPDGSVVIGQRNASDPIVAHVASTGESGYWLVTKGGKNYTYLMTAKDLITLAAGETIVNAVEYGDGYLAVTNTGRVVSRSSYSAYGDGTSGVVAIGVTG